MWSNISVLCKQIFKNKKIQLYFVIWSSGSLTGYLGPVLGSLYDEFSYALYRYTHNVIASGLLSETLQNTLLAQLGVSPSTPDGDWPLQVLPRTLTVLAQVSGICCIFKPDRVGNEWKKSSQRNWCYIYKADDKGWGLFSFMKLFLNEYIHSTWSVLFSLRFTFCFTDPAFTSKTW